MEAHQFNMQITIQKLEEELRSYRNGITSEQYSEILNEKESENERLRIDLGSAEDKIRKFVVMSRQCLQECDSLKEDKSSLIEQNKELAENIANFTRENGEMETKILQLEEEASVHGETIDKLQQRCHSLLSEKIEFSKSLEKERTDRAKEVSKLRDEVEHGQRTNMELKEARNKEHSKRLETSSRLKECEEAVMQTKKALAMSKEMHKKDRETFQLLNATLSEEKHELEGSLSESKHMNSALRTQIDQLEKVILASRADYKNLRDKSIAEINSVSSRLHSELDAKKREADVMAHRMQMLEFERQQFIVDNRASEILKSTVSELEDKIRRQELLLKRPLKDSTNRPLDRPDTSSSSSSCANVFKVSTTSFTAGHIPPSFAGHAPAPDGDVARRTLTFLR